MTREELENLQQKLEDYNGEPIVIGKYVFNEGEGDRYATQIELDSETYLDDEFTTEKSVIKDIKEVFAEVDDGSWMFDEDEDE